MKHIISFFILLSLFGTAHVQYCDFVFLRKQIETSLHIVSFITHEGVPFVVKQSKGADARNHFFVVKEALASHVAQAAGVPVNKVSIISPGVAFTGKPEDTLPATLHTVAPGIRVDKLKKKYIQPDIKQRWYPYDKPEMARGFSLVVIQQMALHADLPKIVALDTFIGNSDRSQNNLFYHKKTNSFCGIDLESTFHRNLCKLAKEQMHLLITSDYCLSRAEYKALKHYNKIFKKLMQLFPPNVLYQKFQEFARQAGFVPGSSLLTKQVQQRCFEHGKKIIDQSYKDGIQLVDLIETLLERYKKVQQRYCKG